MTAICSFCSLCSLSFSPSLSLLFSLPFSLSLSLPLSLSLSSLRRLLSRRCRLRRRHKRCLHLLNSLRNFFRAARQPRIGRCHLLCCLIPARQQHLQRVGWSLTAGTWLLRALIAGRRRWCGIARRRCAAHLWGSSALALLIWHWLRIGSHWISEFCLRLCLRPSGFNRWDAGVKP